MSLVLISKKICSLGCIFLLCVACRRVSTSKDITEEHRDAIDKFNKVVKWPLSPLGRFASDVVRIFMKNSSNALNETLKKGGRNFVWHAMIQTLSNHIGISLCVILGIAICIVLMLLPCFLYLFRSRLKFSLKKSASEKQIDSKPKNLCLFEIFIICVAVAMLGSVIVIIGAIRSYYTLTIPFAFANFTVNAAFQLKLRLLVNHQNRLNDVSRNAFDVIMLLDNINEHISSNFMKSIQDTLQPTLNIATSVKWELIKLIQLLEIQAKLFNEFTNDTENHTNTLVGRFISSVRNLKAEHGNTTLLDPLMNISNLNIVNKSGDVFLAPIPVLQNVSKINIQSGIQKVSAQLKNVSIKMLYDPSKLIEKLKHSSFVLQQNLAESTSKYVKFINFYVKDTDRNPLLDEIGRKERESFRNVFIFNLIILVLAVASLILTLALILSFHFGVCGTSCFRVIKEKNRKVFLRTKASHCAGGSLLLFCFISSVTLWACWLCCVVTFFLTSLPLTCCRAMNDYSILDMTFDSLEFRSSPGWYSLLSSEAFNMTLKQTVIRCKKDQSFVPTIPDPLVDAKSFEKIKSELNFTDLVANYSRDIKNLTVPIDSGFDASKFKLSKLLEKIDVIPSFKSLQSFLTGLTNLNVTTKLEEVKKGAKDQKVAELANTVQQAYDAMISNVSTAIANNETFTSSIKTADLTVKAIEKHVVYLNWTADVLYSSLINGSTGVFNTSINSTLYNVIDNVYLEMRLAALDYRKSMSLCDAIVLFYDKATVILCDVMLYPLACCWFGFFLLTVFQLTAVLLSVKCAGSFIFLPDDFQEDRISEGSVRAEDLPSKSISSVDSKAPDEEKSEKEHEVSAPEDEDSSTRPSKEQLSSKKSD